MADPVPFGVGGPAEPMIESGLPGVLSGIMNFPKHLIDQAAQFDPNDIHGSTARVAPAAAEMAVALMGGGAPAAEKGAAGIFGGRLAKTADIEKLIEANKMNEAGKSPAAIWGDTGWFKSPTDSKWKFEISDDKSRMVNHGLDYSKEGTMNKGPAEAMVQHPELFKAYPSLTSIPFYNSVHSNPLNGIGAGAWHPFGGLEVAAPSLVHAKSVALHELQHGVQQIENFAKGGNPSMMAEYKELKPSKLPLHEQKADPYDTYRRLAGEVESRNVQDRMDFDPIHRTMVSPWETHDTKYRDQLIYDPFKDIIKSLRFGGK